MLMANLEFLASVGFISLFILLAIFPILIYTLAVNLMIVCYFGWDEYFGNATPDLSHFSTRADRCFIEIANSSLDTADRCRRD